MFYTEDAMGYVVLPVELAPGAHRRLMRWCAQTAAALDVVGLARGEVFSALVDALVNNPETAAAVRERLAANVVRPNLPSPRVPVD